MKATHNNFFHEKFKRFYPYLTLKQGKSEYFFNNFKNTLTNNILLI